MRTLKEIAADLKADNPVTPEEIAFAVETIGLASGDEAKRLGETYGDRAPKLRIQGRELKASDKGSKVTYIPTHAEGNAGHKDCEGGTISSWNHHYVFVNYGTGTNQATSPEDLVWG